MILHKMLHVSLILTVASIGNTVAYGENTQRDRDTSESRYYDPSNTKYNTFIETNVFRRQRDPPEVTSDHVVHVTSSWGAVGGAVEPLRLPDGTHTSATVFLGE